MRWPWSKKAETVTYEYKPIPVVLNRVPVLAAAEGGSFYIPSIRPRKGGIRAVLILIGAGEGRSVELVAQQYSRQIAIEWAREYYPALFKEPKGGWKVIERGIMSGGSKR